MEEGAEEGLLGRGGASGLRSTLPPALGSWRGRWAWEGLGRPQGHTEQKGMRVGTRVSPAHPFLCSAHRLNPKPGESQGSVLRGDSPAQGALRFSVGTRPSDCQELAGESGRDGMGATGCRGLRLLDGGQSANRPAPPHSAPGGPGDRPSPRQSQAGRRRGLVSACAGAVVGQESQGWVSLGPTDHHSGPSPGPTPGPRRPPLTRRPVLSELQQLRVLSRNL